MLEYVIIGNHMYVWSSCGGAHTGGLFGGRAHRIFIDLTRGRLWTLSLVPCPKQHLLSHCAEEVCIHGKR